ncbi:MAG: METTL5 family protein [Thermoplasmatota archaeon]
MRKAELTSTLEGVPRHPEPRPELEQYRTPAPIAAELLWLMRDVGDLPARGAPTPARLLDLGCGTGMFAIGGALLGAHVLGVDVDEESIDLARGAAEATGTAPSITWEAADLRSWHPDPGAFDVAVMNPPFGAQKGNRHGDRLFYERAMEALWPGGACWFLAPPRGERFLHAFLAERGCRVQKVGQWDYPLEAQFAFHEKEARVIQVGGYRFTTPPRTPPTTPAGA